MRLSPTILSAATVAVAMTTSSNSSASGVRAQREGEWSGDRGPRALPMAPYQRTNRPELSTEFFIVPELAGKRRVASVASVASVVSVPAPNRTISVYRGVGGWPPALPAGHPGDEPQVGPLGLPLLRQQPWALPLAALSAATMLLMAAFEVFVLFKVRWLFFFAPKLLYRPARCCAHF